MASLGVDSKEEEYWDDFSTSLEDETSRPPPPPALSAQGLLDDSGPSSASAGLLGTTSAFSLGTSGLALGTSPSGRTLLDATLQAACASYAKSAFQAAREGFERAIALAEELGDVEDEIDARRLLAETYLKIPHAKSLARECAVEARKLCGDNDDDEYRERRAACDETIASCDAAEQKWDRAIETLRSALDTYRQNDDVAGQLSSLGKLGVTLVSAGVALSAAANDEKNEAMARHVWQQAADATFQEALARLNERIELAERHPDTDDGRHIGRVYGAMADVHSSIGNTGDVVRAIELSEKALIASVRGEDHAQELSSLASLANLHEHMGVGWDNEGGMRSVASAAEFRRKLFEILWKRHGVPTPTHCVICAEAIGVLDATEMRSDIKDEITVLTSCLHTVHTSCLTKWRATPYRSSVLSPLARAPNACPVCEDPNQEHRKTREMDAWRLANST
ncbi:RING-type domain-containing protein [Pseudoscourfieldia marina]